MTLEELEDVVTDAKAEGRALIVIRPDDTFVIIFGDNYELQFYGPLSDRVVARLDFTCAAWSGDQVTLWSARTIIEFDDHVSALTDDEINDVIMTLTVAAYENSN